MKFTITDTQYFEGISKHGKNVVVCKLYGYWSESLKTNKDVIDDLESSKVLSKNSSMPFWAVNHCIEAKAICNDDDVYDFEVGKRIAESKAKAKMFKETARTNADIIDTLEAALGAAKKELEKNERCYLKEVDHLKDIETKIEEAKVK